MNTVMKPLVVSFSFSTWFLQIYLTCEIELPADPRSLPYVERAFRCHGAKERRSQIVKELRQCDSRKSVDEEHENHLQG